MEMAIKRNILRPVGTVGACRAGGASGAARHIDAVNNGRQDIDQNYTAALTLKFAKVAVFNVWLLLVILCVNYLRHRCNILQLVGSWSTSVQWC